MTNHRPFDANRLESRSHLPWRILRWLTQSIALFAIVFGPFLGAWQRLDRAYLSAWNSEDWELPLPLAARLPHDESTRIVYEINSIIGGGSAANYISLPIADPMGAFIAWIAEPQLSALSQITWIAWIAGLGPLALGFLGGRIFCGWFCPFGSLSRITEGLLERIPWKIPRPVLPTRRPLRFLLLILCIVFAALGSHFVFYASLPYILMQQSLYSMWILGGGGAVFGAFLGLLAAGLFFGPNTYCATLCPTGALLNVIGRKKAIRLKIVDFDDCGAHCDLCDRGCWLALQPSRGDPGPDCDSCGRCMEVCPSNNLRLYSIRKKHHTKPNKNSEQLGSLGTESTTSARTTVPLTFAKNLVLCLSSHQIYLLACFFSLLLSSACSSSRIGQEAESGHALSEGLHAYEIGPSRPKLVFEQFVQLKDRKSVGLSVVDLRHVQLDADDESTIGHTEISLYLAEIHEKQFDEHGGILPSSKIYKDQIRLDLHTQSPQCPKSLVLKSPNSPISTPNRSVYRSAVPCRIVPGDTIRLSTIANPWLAEPVEWKVPYVSSGDNWTSVPLYFAIGFLLYAGLQALAIGQRDSVRGPNESKAQPSPPHRRASGSNMG